LVQHSDEYWKDLIRSTYDQKEDPILGEFDRLQRLNITHLLNEIVRIKASIRHNQTTSQEQIDRLREVMHQYGEPKCQINILCEDC
jgi:hypothetical protein